LDIKKVEEIKRTISKIKNWSQRIDQIRVDVKEIEDLTRRVSKLKSWS
jgi:hypothetical protein